MKSYLSKPKDEYLVKDPNLNVHFKIINGVRYWLTPPPSDYKKRHQLKNLLKNYANLNK